MCYLSGPGNLVKKGDYLCPNSSCGALIATKYHDSTCSACSMFVSGARGTVIARIELAAVKPVLGGTKARDGRLIKKDRLNIKGRAPFLINHAMNGDYRSVISTKNRALAAHASILSELGREDTFQNDFNRSSAAANGV